MTNSNTICALIVDDDPAYLSVLKLCLRLCDIQRVHAAPNGAVALEYMDYTQYQLIISDWNMCPVDGLELLRAVRSEPKTRATPFILMTANLSEYAWREAIKFGASDFLLKPFSLAALRAACRGCLFDLGPSGTRDAS